MTTEIGIYEDALRYAKKFSQRTDQKRLDIVDPRWADIGQVFVRTSSWKKPYFLTALQALGAPITTRAPDWREDDQRSKYMSRQLSSALKAEDMKHDIRDGLPLIDGKRVLSVASDVEVMTGSGRVLKKPLEATSRDDIYHLLQRITGQQAQAFAIETSIAVMQKTIGSSQKGQGLTLSREHTAVLTGLSDQEIELYVYGLAGMHNDHPEYLNQILLRNLDGMSAGEAELVAQGLTLDELKLSNGALRWPHPLFRQHIANIDGVESSSALFSSKMMDMFRSLLGAPAGIRSLISGVTNADFMSKLLPPGANAFDYISSVPGHFDFYPSYMGEWAELVQLRDGGLISLTSATPGDAEAISKLAALNFNAAENYRCLIDDERARFLSANSPEGILELMRNLENLCFLVAKSLAGQVLGYIVVRNTGNGAAIIKRMHTHLNMTKQGLGAVLMTHAEQIACQVGYHEMEVQATGGSYNWFTRIGYNNTGVYPIVGANFNGRSTAVYHAMKKSLLQMAM